jgi:glycyl-tRNA synthetase beta chain
MRAECRCGARGPESRVGSPSGAACTSVRALMSARDLLLEIGVEELPASFVDSALAALPSLATKMLARERLAHGSVHAWGTPRRLALFVESVADLQPDLEEEVQGPPARAAYQNGEPTKAAKAFADKLGVDVSELRRVETPKGEYVAGTRREKGRPAAALLGEALAALVLALPFRKSMRWADLEVTFGRPIQWLVALHGSEVVPFELAGLVAGRSSRGHRFLAPASFDLPGAGSYQSALAEAHVLVDVAARRERMKRALDEAAAGIGATLVHDEFLLDENLHLTEEPHVVVGSFDPAFLSLPERVIMEVAKGHQRYFCGRAPDGSLLPRYFAVVGTANDPAAIARGNDRVMRARLADAKFFFDEDAKIPLAERRDKLANIVFQKRLGSVLDKAKRIERLARELGLLLMRPEPVLMAAASGAHLAKCDLVALTVGEFPELQGEMGRAYALAQGVAPEVADVIRDHYLPKGANDRVAPTDEAALVAIADRLDTLVGCFAVGLSPTGAADPYALRRAAIGVLRTLLERSLDLSITTCVRAAYDGFEGVKLDLSASEAGVKVSDFVRERLRGLLGAELPADAVDAALGAAGDRPVDARARARAIAGLSDEVRSGVGEVFKRATNIAESADPSRAATPPPDGAHESERALYAGFVSLRDALGASLGTHDYAAAFDAIASFAPLLSRYFTDVFVMADDVEVRAGRLALMRGISESCRSLAHLELLAR